MLRQWTTILAILTILAVLMPGTTLTSSAAAQTSSSACFALPADTADGWTDLFPCCGDEKQCMRMCNRWLQTCNAMANASYRCFLALFKSLAEVDGAECAVSKDPPLCSADVRMNESDSKRSLKEDLKEATVICDENLDDCIDNCLGDD